MFFTYSMVSFKCYRSYYQDDYVVVTFKDWGSMKLNILAARRMCKEIYFFTPKVCEFMCVGSVN